MLVTFALFSIDWLMYYIYVKNLHIGRSSLSTWKYQFSYNHWSQAMLSSDSTWMGDCWSVVWLLLLTLKSRLDLISRVLFTGCWLCVDAELAIGQCRLGPLTEPVVWSTLGTTCGRCQAGLEIPEDLPMWSLVGQQDWKKGPIADLWVMLVFETWLADCSWVCILS